MFQFLMCNTVILMLLASLFLRDAGASMDKALRCHVCNNRNDLECDFIYDGFVRFLTQCNDTFDEDTMTTSKAKCVVQRITEDRFPLTKRMCGPVNCPRQAKCCECSKTGCNGENDCLKVFSNSYSIAVVKSLTFLNFCLIKFWA